MIDRDAILKKDHVGVLIIGGGPAGLAAAAAARKAGVDDILIIERDRMLGGILNQCIHNGFGLHTFKEELTGPEYAARFISQIRDLEIPYLLNTMVLSITRDKRVTIIGSRTGIRTISADAIILAMGCRERSRGALSIPGYRPAGVYTAGTAQRLMNIEGYQIGKRVVILGSGDIGLIMARRMTLEGAKVLTVAELMPYSGGLKRNIVQCLNDYDIPLQLSHTVVNILGKERVEGVTIAEVDASRKPIPGTEVTYDCDTLLLSCGLLPENELTRMLSANMSPVTGGASVDDLLQTDVPGVFACGNVLHVHDLVDYVSEEAALAGENAAAYVSGTYGKGSSDPIDVVEISTDGGVRYTVPQRIHVSRMRDSVTVRFRVADVYRDKTIAVYRGERCLSRRKTRVLAPGEMEQVKLEKKDLQGLTAAEGLRVVLESDTV